MYKVFINDKRVLLTNILDNISPESQKKYIKFDGIENLIAEIERIESGETIENDIIIYSDDIDILRKAFISLFRVIEAAGGIVRNENNEVLFIYRLNRWDLPKGKIEKNEGIKAAAIREVIEETGLKTLNLGIELSPTFHSYIKKGERILKKTYWFEMFAPSKQILYPQKKEKITDVRWFNASEINEPLDNTYSSIKDLITDHFRE